MKMKGMDSPELNLGATEQKKQKAERTQSLIPLGKLDLVATLGRLKAMEIALQPYTLDPQKYRKSLIDVKDIPIAIMRERLMNARLDEVEKDPEYFSALIETFDQRKITRTLRELLVKENSNRFDPQEEFKF